MNVKILKYKKFTYHFTEVKWKKSTQVCMPIAFVDWG